MYLIKANAYKLHNKSENLEIILDTYMAMPHCQACRPGVSVICQRTLRPDGKSGCRADMPSNMAVAIF